MLRQKTDETEMTTPEISSTEVDQKSSQRTRAVFKEQEGKSINYNNKRSPLKRYRI